VSGLLRTFHELSLLPKREPAAVRRAPLPHTRARSRCLFGVEALEPRWLLSVSSPAPVDITQTTPSVAISETNGAFNPTVLSQDAQVLPDVADLQVTGDLYNAAAVFAIPLEASQQYLDIGLQGTTADTSLNANLVLVAPSGQILNPQASGSTAPAFSVNPILDLIPSGSSSGNLYVVISPAQNSGSTATASASGSHAIPFTLDVVRTTAVPNPTYWQAVSSALDSAFALFELSFTPVGMSGSPSVSQVQPSGVTASTPTPTPTTTPTPTSFSPFPTPPSSPPGLPQGPAPAPIAQPSPTVTQTPATYPVATGMMPARSAAPLGGVFAIGDPAPLVDRREPAFVDLALNEPVRDPHGDQALVEREVVPVALGIGASRTGPVLAYQGPEAFPLAASAVFAELARKSAPLPPSAPTAEASAARERLERSFIPRMEPNSPSAPTGRTASRARLGWPRRLALISRPSVLPAVTLTAALGLVLLLPEAVAAFESTTPLGSRVRRGRIQRALRRAWV
jgi:hypothetical protein